MKHVARLATLALLPILVACHSRDADHASSATTLKMYEVPPAQTSALSHALTLALSKDASVATAGPGKLLVYAPADAQASIESAIAALRDSAPAHAIPAQVELHAWIISAEPGDTPDDPALKELGPSLAALRQTMGPTSFHLGQAISAAGSENHHSMLALESQGSFQQFDFAVGTIQNDALGLDLTYNVTGSTHISAGPELTGLQAHLDTRLGQYTLLAKVPDNSCSTAPAATPTPCEKGWRLLVIRADRIEASH
jgi:hypothetical protein